MRGGLAMTARSRRQRGQSDAERNDDRHRDRGGELASRHRLEFRLAEAKPGIVVIVDRFLIAHIRLPSRGLQRSSAGLFGQLIGEGRGKGGATKDVPLADSIPWRGGAGPYFRKAGFVSLELSPAQRRSAVR
jgi:hypothetical protein